MKTVTEKAQELVSKSRRLYNYEVIANEEQKEVVVRHLLMEFDDVILAPPEVLKFFKDAHDWDVILNSPVNNRISRIEIHEALAYDIVITGLGYKQN